jgi:protein-tyrosine phosphatase
MTSTPASDPTRVPEPVSVGSLGVAERLRGVVRSAGASRFLQGLRHLPDRRLHRRRRRRALETLEQGPRPSVVLFVCHGNLYRSPYAEHAFRAALPEEHRDGIHALSAGFAGPGRPTPEPAVEFAASRGVDLTAHRSSPLTAATVAAASLIVVMEPLQRRAILERFGRPRAPIVVLGDLDPEPILTRDVRDPWGQPLEVLHDSYLRIERCARVLAGAVAARRAAPFPERVTR